MVTHAPTFVSPGGAGKEVLSILVAGAAGYRFRFPAIKVALCHELSSMKASSKQ